MAGNDDGDNYAYDCFSSRLFLFFWWIQGKPKSRLTFNAVETETYIVLVAGYDGSEGVFTLSAECSDTSNIPD